MNRKHRTLPKARTTIATMGGVCVIVSAGCLQVNEEHCIAQSGDHYCGTLDRETPMCTMSPDGSAETSESGCLKDVPESLVHVKYGLPQSFDAFLSNLALAAPGCADHDAQKLQADYDVLFERVISFLDGRSRVSKDSLPLKESVDDFNAAVDAWIAITCDEALDTGTETSSVDTGPMTETWEGSATGPSLCTMDEECTEATPFCDARTGACVTCEQTEDPAGSCAGLDPLLPLCVDGECVACTSENPVVCDQQLLSCDNATHTCAPCAEHEQCESGACELAIGSCFPNDTVVHVDGDQGRDFESVTEAITSIGDGMPGVIIVHELDDGSSYQASVTIDGAKRIALLAAPDEAPSLLGTIPVATGVTVEGAATIVYMDRIRIANSSGRGLHAIGAFVWVDRSQITLNVGRGIFAEGGAELVLRNSIVGGNGTAGICLPDVPCHGIDVSDSDALILYSTVARNRDVVIDSIRCTGGSVEVRNSLVVGRQANSIDCPGITIINSALDENFGSNVNVGPSKNSWFTNVKSGDFHLSEVGSGSGASVFAGIAQWQAGDPLTDIDGEPRPAADGTLDYAGADVP